MFVLLLLLHVDYLVTEDYKNSYNCSFFLQEQEHFVLLLLPQVNYFVVEDYNNSYELFIFLARTRAFCFVVVATSKLLCC
jgi:hypothetical protein